MVVSAFCGGGGHWWRSMANMAQARCSYSGAGQDMCPKLAMAQARCLTDFFYDGECVCSLSVPWGGAEAEEAEAKR